ncbi:MAG: hypothetical protein QOH04_991 [Sphingomonadales bacterium]|jgi:tetratricopeptide (TPR) repeat protein|nr:hypothetical protein [Sphingomonadales bacterium]
MGDGASTGGPGYRAFISYSHKDAAVGRWLHRRLEGYRLPRRLAGTEGEHGAVPARLTPIFRDREELPAAGDLSERVRSALAASGSLIVVCSPDAAGSPWVAKEIASFRELHPDRPILAAIVEGEPAECFPAALTAGGRVEPLAADFRPGRDGRRLGVLKLVAALAGVGLDALVQRDAQRRVRRVTYVTAAALAAVLVMAVLTTMALRERREAQTERAKAEGLVEFMLTDLRERLKGVGRLDVLTAANERALAYYDSDRDPGRLSDESLARRARILQAIAEDDLKRHDTTGALTAYARARDTTAEQVSRAPRDPQRLFEHGTSVGGIGRVHEVRDEWEEAEGSFSQLADLSHRLISLAPRNPEYLMRGASAAIDLGNVCLRYRRDCAGSRRFYERAIGLIDRADSEKPGDRHILLTKANTVAWLADSFYHQGRWQDSLVARQRQRAIVERLAEAHPSDVTVSYWLAAAYRGLAYSFERTGARTDARAYLERAATLSARLVRRDPQNQEWATLHAKLQNDLVRIAQAGLPRDEQRCGDYANSRYTKGDPT